ncbi:MAG: sugar transferase [Phycisphaerae bacterium]|jgi:lipopolysaccharide/colanic/teichoic acid biosynthesis glycosyltransferase
MSLYDFSKRFIDLVVSFLALFLLSPLMLLIVVAVRLESRGNPLFCQVRAGRGAEPFMLFKFRTMRPDVDPYGNSPQDGRDPRLTKIGRWLRETSLDELPQLLNVMMGEMSLVGPRPLYVVQVLEWNERQRRRLEVKPGLTGLAQISGRGSLTIEEKLELDVEYVEKRSFLLDMKILLYTFISLFSPGHIYEKRYSEKHERRK